MKLKKKSAPYKMRCKKLRKRNKELVAEKKGLEARISELNKFNRHDIIDVEVEDED